VVGDDRLKAAVAKILQRSERQEDLGKLVGTFVDVGILPQLENRNNQIFYGRRGTGKTHVLRVLGARLRDAGELVVYIDARTLGSTAQFSDPTVPLRQRCLALFRDVLTPIHDRLLEHIIDHPPLDPAVGARALDACDALGQSIIDPVETVSRSSVKENVAQQIERSGSARAELGRDVAKLSAAAETKAKDEKAWEVTSTVRTDDKVVFPTLHGALNDTLSLSDVHLVILFDEWSSLPSDVQPYLAEFLKRGVLPVQRATIKIASLEYRSRFTLHQGQGYLGFELGADISAAQDIDDYYVFDRNPEAITDAYADILYRHLAAELPADYLDSLRIPNPAALQSRLFTEKATFQELARASEGVVRDLINIFTKAYFDALRRRRDSIDRKAILDAARGWFEQDKAQHLDDSLHEVLRRIVDEVIGNRRARSFMLPRELEHHPVVQRLFDARVLHHMQRGYAHKDNPGVRYNIYSLDYGTYVDLLGTSKQPELTLAAVDENQERDEEFAVPFDDKRAIRRILLTEDVLANPPRSDPRKEQPIS
jgi:hypothetical protein